MITDIRLAYQLTSFRSKMYSLLAYPYYREITPTYGYDLVLFLRAFEALPDDALYSELKSSAAHVLQYAQDLTSDEYMEKWATLFARIFLISVDEYGVKPYESVYLSPSKLVMQRERDEVFKVFCENKMVKQENFKEPEDHISAELTFLAAMSDKSEDALKAGNMQAFTENIKNQRHFLDEHIIKWLPMLVADMKRADKDGFFANFATLTETFIKYDREILDDLMVKNI